MKVLLVTGSYPPLRCGVGDYCRQLAGALADRGAEVAVLTSQGAPDRAGERVTVFGRMPDWSLRSLPQLLRTLREWRPDIVHVQYPTQGYRGGRLPALVPLLSWLTGARPVRTWHEPHGLRAAPGLALQLAAPGPYVHVRPHFHRQLPALCRLLLAGRRGKLIAGASAIPRSRMSASERELLRQRMLGGATRLIVFFGFLYPFKGADLLFDIARPESDRLVIAGESPDADHFQLIADRAKQPPWAGKVTLAGYLSPEESADLLAAADAVVLPFRLGGGVWNSSIHAALLQGTPVITTASEMGGLDPSGSIYWARIDDLAEMRQALDQLAGRRNAIIARPDDWPAIAGMHLDIYSIQPGRRSGTPPLMAPRDPAASR